MNPDPLVWQVVVDKNAKEVLIASGRKNIFPVSISAASEKKLLSSCCVIRSELEFKVQKLDAQKSFSCDPGVLLFSQNKLGVGRALIFRAQAEPEILSTDPSLLC